MNLEKISLQQRKMQIDWIIEILKETNFVLGNERAIELENEKILRRIFNDSDVWPVIDNNEVEITAFDLGKLWPESIFIQEGRILKFQKEFDPTKQSIILYNNEFYDEKIYLVLGYFPKE